MTPVTPPLHGFDIAPGEEEFFAFVAEHFSRTYYLESYGEVAQAALDPLQHWLDLGIKEGRQISRYVVLRFGKVARRSSSRIWNHYRWRGEEIAVRLIKPLPAEVLSQIVYQARHDPAVLAAGASAIANLTQQDRENVHLDIVGLQRAIPQGAEFLLIIPNLSIEAEQTLTIDLVAALRDAGFRSIQTIVADQESAESVHSAVPELLRTTNVVFWQDFWIHGSEAVQLGQLAQLIRVLRPRVVIVANSRRGYEMVARYGRELSDGAKLYCIYIDAQPEFSARFPRRTLPFATALTDDLALAASLHERYGDLLGHSVMVLPRHSAAAFRDAVTALFRSA